MPCVSLEVDALQDHRSGHDQEQTADQDEQQLGAAEDGECCQRAAEGERSGVAHEDLRRRGVPPEEADEGADDRRRDHAEVERIAHLVALERHVWVEIDVEAGLVGLPEPDEDVGREREDRRAGGEAVEPVGDVHSVRGADGDDVDPDHEQDHADHRPEEEQVEPGDVAHEGDEVRRRRQTVLVGEHREDREQREHGSHDDLAGDLRPAGEAQAALLAGLGEVVDEPDESHPPHHPQHEHRDHRPRDAAERPLTRCPTR